MRFLKENGRKPTLSDSSTVMSINGDFQAIALSLGQTLPSVLLAELHDDLAFELQQITLYDDTGSVLQSLKNAGYSLALCSNTATPYGEVVADLLPEMLMVHKQLVCMPVSSIVRLDNACRTYCQTCYERRFNQEK